MIFNALAILLVGALMWHAATEDFFSVFVRWVYGLGFSFIVGVTLWLNWLAARNPRFLAYGPREYLRESELAHERKMKGIE